MSNGWKKNQDRAEQAKAGWHEVASGKMKSGRRYATITLLGASVERNEFLGKFRIHARSQTPFGNAPRETPFPGWSGQGERNSPGAGRVGKRSFHECVPKRSLGTRLGAHYTRRLNPRTPLEVPN
jgi:hypothetical protein